MFVYIKKDIQRYTKREENQHLINKIRLILSTPGIHALIVYRFGRWIITDKNKLSFIWCFNPIYRLFNYLIKKLYDINISQEANITPGLFIGHFAGIEIGSCFIGQRCSVHQHVKICTNNTSLNTSVNIGNNVWIGSHSSIDCGLDIADGSTISAGSIVTSDIETSSLVLGNPARVIRRNYDNSSIL